MDSRPVVVGSVVVVVVLGIVLFVSERATRNSPVEPPALSTSTEPTPPPPAEEPPVFDPEMQPRTTYVQEFAGLDALPKGFVLEGLVLTDQGIELPPGDGPRQGTITSPDEITEFPGNSFAPLWRQKLADGTRIDVEFALSPDGIEWGPWTRVIADDEAHTDIFPTYPDGSPNPFYGFQPGGLFNWGAERWEAFRYRMVLSSENSASPVLGAVRFFYQDSTLGEGVGGSLESLEELAAQLAPAEPVSQTVAP